MNGTFAVAVEKRSEYHAQLPEVKKLAEDTKRERDRARQQDINKQVALIAAQQRAAEVGAVGKNAAGARPQTLPEIAR